MKEYLKDIPVRWDETKFITGFPGEEVVIARGHGLDWFVSGINGNAREKTLDLDLKFLTGKTGNIITDGASCREFENRDFTLHAQGHLKITVRPNGGFAIKVK